MATSARLPAAAAPQGRTLVICFDGTNNIYGEKNTNVVRLFALLEKQQSDRQLVYYQAGIGTYTNPAIWTPIFNFVARIVDEAIAWYLDAHVLGGYRFLMQNYKAGDKICIFGYSRGAYAGRALAGMLTKVGLVPPDMPEQLTFAYRLYKGSSPRNSELCRGFKQTFSRTVSIEFVGVWETISAVGIIWSRYLPFSSSDSIIRTFRQALALDERRARYQTNLWNQGEGSAKDDSTQRQEDSENGIRPLTDVKEVWFAGCHADVGGGAVRDTTPNRLSSISFRWMVAEIVQARCGILFDPDALQRANLDISLGNPHFPVDTHAHATDRRSSPNPDDLDALAPIHNFLLIPVWWPLEFIPIINSYQGGDGKWHFRPLLNLFGPRKVHGDVLLHETVKLREDDPNSKYKPKAKWTGTSRFVTTGIQKVGTEDDE